MKLFVYSLSYDTTEKALREMFEQWGQVTECSIAVDRDTKRPRGFAFITMPISTQAETAMQQVTGAKLDGRVIRVDVARNQEDRRSAGRRYDTRSERR